MAGVDVIVECRFAGFVVQTMMPPATLPVFLFRHRSSTDFMPRCPLAPALHLHPSSRTHFSRSSGTVRDGDRVHLLRGVYLPHLSWVRRPLEDPRRETSPSTMDASFVRLGSRLARSWLVPGDGGLRMSDERHDWTLHVRSDGKYELREGREGGKKIDVRGAGEGGVALAKESNQHTAFEIKFCSDGRASLWFPAVAGFLACDLEGALWAEKTTGTAWSKWEWKETPFPGNDLNTVSLVKVNLKARNGKYLCCACTVPNARAEVPCCCEEIVLNVQGPDPGMSSHGGGHSAIISNGGIQTLMNVDEEGKVFFHGREAVMGQEAFQLVVEDACKCELSLRSSSTRMAVRVLKDGNVLASRKTQKLGKDCRFVLELCKESAVYLRSCHDTFLAVPISSLQETRSTCKFVPASAVNECAKWAMHAHGDNLYSIRQTAPSGTVKYLVPMDNGTLCVTNEPGMCFPSKSCLWSLELVQEEGKHFKGFAFRSHRYIKGKRLYLGSEPCGSGLAARHQAGRWECFSIVDHSTLVKVAAVKGGGCAVQKYLQERELILSRFKACASLQDLCRWKLAQSLELVHFRRNTASGSAMQRCYSFSDLEEDFEGEFADLPEQYAMQVRSALRNLIPRARSCKWKLQGGELARDVNNEWVPLWPGQFKCSSCMECGHRLLPLEKEVHPEHHRYLEMLDQDNRTRQNGHVGLHVLSIVLASCLTLFCGSKGKSNRPGPDIVESEEPKLTMSLHSVFGERASVLQRWMAIQVSR